MELKQYLRIVWKWLWLMVLSTAIAVAVSYYFTAQQPKLYQASAKLLVGQSIQNANPNAQDLYTSEQLALTYIQIARTLPVLQSTIDDLGVSLTPDQLAGMFSANIIQGTQIIELRVIDTDPLRAQALANELAFRLTQQAPSSAEQDQLKRRSFIQQQVDELEKKIQEAQVSIADLQRSLPVTASAREIADNQQKIAALQGQSAQWQQTYAALLAYLAPQSPNYLSIIEPASLPRYPIGPNVTQTLLIAAAMGLALGLAGALLIEYLDDAIKTPEDITELLQLPTIGSIARIQGGQDRKLVTAVSPRSPISEAYRVLRTNIQFASLDKPLKSILVTSAGPYEGKSVTAANLAIAMALVGQRTILVDADFRKPAQQRLFGVTNDVGLANALLAQSELGNFLRPTRIENLRLLTTGMSLPNPAEVLASERMRGLVAQLKEEADIIIFDSPPCIPVADPAILSRLADGVILVVDSVRTHRDAAVRAKGIMEKAGARMLGIVLNRFRPQSGTGHYYYQYYSSHNPARNWRKPAPKPASAPTTEG